MAQGDSVGTLEVRAVVLLFVNHALVYYIYDEAQRQGAYRVERGMTLRQALEKGGGPTVRGTERSLKVERRAADGSFQPLKLDMNAQIQPDDVIYVPESLF